MEGDENETGGVTISVIDTEIHSEKLTKHVRYSISGKDETGPFACVRRYKEFAALRQVLVIVWPGCYVPQIPQKQVVVGVK
jgi:hypothetical protein